MHIEGCFICFGECMNPVVDDTEEVQVKKGTMRATR